MSDLADSSSPPRLPVDRRSWLRPAATGLFAGAAAVVALAISRPALQPPPVFLTAPTFGLPGASVDDRTYPLPAGLSAGELLRGWSLPPAPFADGAGPALRRALDAPLDHFAVKDARAEDALALWGVQAGANVAVDWPQLGRAKFDPGLPMSLDLRGVRAEQVLRILLDRLNESAAGSAPSKLAVYADGDVLRVEAPADSGGGRVVVKMYDIAQLLSDAAVYSNRTDGDPSDPPTKTELVDNLIQAIESMVDRDGWADNGGQTGSIKELAGRLFIAQTPEGHAQLDRFFAEFARRQRARLALPLHRGKPASTRPSGLFGGG